MALWKFLAKPSPAADKRPAEPDAQLPLDAASDFFRTQVDFAIETAGIEYKNDPRSLKLRFGASMTIEALLKKAMDVDALPDGMPTGITLDEITLEIRQAGSFSFSTKKRQALLSLSILSYFLLFLRNKRIVRSARGNAARTLTSRYLYKTL